MKTLLSEIICAGISLALSACLLGSDVADEWKYEYVVNAPGTKSEVVSGRLKYRDRELPMEMKDVITPIGEFCYFEYSCGRFAN